MRRFTPGLAFMLSLSVVAALLTPASAQAALRKQLVPGFGAYARLLRLEYSAFGRGNIIASLTSQDGGGK